MKNKFNYKTYTKILSLFCILCILVGSNIVYAQNDDKSEKQYVIITENADKTTDLISDKKIEDVCENKKSPDIVVANLTENQADKIENKDFVICVEEDITLTGSFDEEGKKNVEKTKTDDLNQWYLDAIGVEKTEKPKSQVKVALLDSGVSYTDDVDVEENVNFVDDTSINPLFVDGNGHGSALASVICAKDNGEGITGVNPNVCLYSAKVLDDENKAPLSRIIQGIYWAIDNNVDIINMSFGTSVNSQALHNAIKQVAKKDILMIAAAGNTKHKDVQYPAAYNEVIAVGSTNTNGELSENTSSGTELELVAPGEKIIANGFLSMPEVVSGTSIATAQVTGVASLLLQKDLSKSADFIRQLLKTSAKEVKYGISQTVGLVDYSYANDIYNKFAIKYKFKNFLLNGIKNLNNLKNAELPENYTTNTKNITVDGLWNGSDHSNLSGSLISNFGTKEMKNNIEYIKKGSREADGNILREAVILHGKSNYVASLKFLIDFANQLKTKTVRNAKNKAINLISKSLPIKNKNHITESASKIETVINKKNYNKIQNYYYVIGLCMHQIGDVYTHRTIVPKSAVNGGRERTNKTIGSNDFVSKPNLKFTADELKAGAKNPNTKVRGTKLRCWEALKISILNYQIIEYIDIKFYMKKDDLAKANDFYEDSTSFRVERWNESKTAIDWFIADKFKFDEVIFDPRHNTKLNNYYGYCNDIGINTSYYSKSYWSKISTLSEV